MVNGFEKRTRPLEEHEVKVIVPFIVSRLRFNIGVENAVTTSKITSVINSQGYKYKSKKGREKNVKVDGPRFRQMIHYIRVNSLIANLIATSKGYYVTKSTEELEKYVESLKQRRNSLQEILDAMSHQLELTKRKNH